MFVAILGMLFSACEYQETPTGEVVGEDEIIIDKTRYDAFFKTKLKEILDRDNIDTVIITGTMTHICCESTARTAMYLDYNVILCTDLTFADEKANNNTKKTIASHFGKTMDSKQILANF